MLIKPIKGKTDYKQARRRVEELRRGRRSAEERDELEVLRTLIEAWERKRYLTDFADPVEAIRFRLEQLGKTRDALIGVIGPNARVYEVLRGRRPLSISMIRNLHEKFGIPAEVLIRPARNRGGTVMSRRGDRIDRYPTMRRRGRPKRRRKPR